MMGLASFVMILCSIAGVAVVWMNGSLLGEKQEVARQAQVERADYKACMKELTLLKSKRGARR